MNCPFCSIRINEDDHRCSNCGRRLSGGSGALPVSRGAAALQMDPGEAHATAVLDSPRLELTSGGRQFAAMPQHASATQSSLFQLHESLKVVSIGGPDTRGPSRRRERFASPRSSYLPYQGVLEFVPDGAPPARLLATSVEAAVFCDFPVAGRTHRFLAGILDLSLIVVAMSLFLAVIASGCEALPWLTLNSQLLSLGAIVTATGGLGFLYEAFWVASGVPSPGMRWAGLRLVHFEGYELTPGDAGKRILGALISVLPGAIGLLWALVDEESLTWQDYISRTFPTPVRGRIESE